MKDEIKKDFELTNEYMRNLALNSSIAFMELGFAFAQLEKEISKFLKEHLECLLPTYHWDFDNKK